ncbi:MAG TPA: LPXTG cell wall anchor domain-containing protein [Acidimicrobiales bacterium]|nr:LPXTG cell wall anchor domain-containing protein [Acidimicrobiales bacterium]
MSQESLKEAKMVVRRILLGAGALVFLAATPAAAAQSYNDVLGAGQTRRPTVVDPGGVRAASTGGSSAGSASGAGSDLPRTGSSDLVPLAEAATALIGGVALLVLVARRRRLGTATA